MPLARLLTPLPRPLLLAVAHRPAAAAASLQAVGAPASRRADMDRFKELVAAKRKTADEEFQGKKYMKRSEIEALRMAKLREEEEQERAAKVTDHLGLQ